MIHKVCNKLCPEVERLLKAKNDEIYALKRVIRHQDEIMKFVDIKMREIRLENERLFSRNEELESFYKANAPRNVFQKQHTLKEVKVDNLEKDGTIFGDHGRKEKTTKQLFEDPKKNAKDDHFGTKRILVKDAKTLKQEKNDIPKIDKITVPFITAATSSQITKKDIPKMEKYTAKSCVKLPKVPFTLPSKTKDIITANNRNTKVPMEMKLLQKPKQAAAMDQEYYYGSSQPEYQPHGPSPALYSESWD